MSFGSNGWICCVRCEKFQHYFVYRTWALMVLICQVFHRLLCSNETVRNAPKHELWVQWSGSGAFVAKNFNATSFSELGRQRCQFGQFCISFRAVTKWPETSQNMRIGSNGVDRVRSLLKIWTQLGLANLRISSTSSASFASTFVQ
jgi:hypothetical protein